MREPLSVLDPSSVAPPTDDESLLARPPVLRLDGKVALITGASRGLGRALAFAFAGAGAEVLLMARTQSSLAAVADVIRRAGGRAEIAVGSVDVPADVLEAASIAERTWGKLDALVNNAGVSPTYRRSESVGDDEWTEILDINLTGPFRCSRAVLPLLEQAGGGAIVNVSSVHGMTGHGRMAAYSASKGGLELLTRTLALEWADKGVRVNAVAPGYLATDMTKGLREHPALGAELLRDIPMGRVGESREIVGAVLFLAGAASSYMTGATVAVDGGWLAR